MRRINLVVISIIMLVVMPSAWGTTIRVPQDQPTIQAGINAAANGDTVLVGDGTWSGPGNRDLRFSGKEIVVRSANGPGSCIIDCNNSSNAFYLNESEGPGAAIIGFRIFNGSASHGGGIRLGANTAVTISGNWFLECSAVHDGGGLSCEYGSVARVIENHFDHCSAGGNGGAIDCFQASPHIAGNLIYNNSAGYGGGIICNGSGSPYIRGNRIYGNHAQENGGGICVAVNSTPVVVFNEIKGNRGEEGGGGFSVLTSTTYPITVADNQIDSNISPARGGGVLLEEGAYVFFVGGSVSDNSSGSGGGGFYVGEGCDTSIRGTLVAENSCGADGGGIAAFHADPVTLSNVTVADNEAYGYGGGLYANDTEVTAQSSIIWGNQAGMLDGVYITPFIYYFTPTYCDIQDGGWTGEGVISQNPLFVSGPQDDYYLSQTRAGQTTDSPCVDSGHPDQAIHHSTTRSDCVIDDGIVDMGDQRDIRYLVAGPGRGYDNPPRVRVYPPIQGASPIADFQAYGAPHYGVNMAVGRVESLERQRIITGAGPGAIYGPHVRGFDAAGTPLPGLSFLAYGTQKYGVNVTTGNLDGAGHEEIITGAGPGAVFGPHVRAFTYVDGAVTPLPEVSFFAYGTLKFGVNVTAGDIDGDRRDEIITGAGPGAVFGPHVRGWDLDGGTVAANPRVSFLAYGTNKYGVNVGCGDIDGDGIDEILTGPGPSGLFGAQIRGWNYDGVNLDDIPDCNFFAWTPAQALYGARVSASDLDYDGLAEIIVGAGPDPSVDTTIKVFRYYNYEVTEQFNLRAFPEHWTSGANAVGGAM